MVTLTKCSEYHLTYTERITRCVLREELGEEGMSSDDRSSVAVVDRLLFLRMRSGVKSPLLMSSD